MEDGEVVYCDECGLPAARVVGSNLVIESRHHGQKHRTVIQIGRLTVMANRQLAKARESLHCPGLLTIDKVTVQR